MTALTPSADRLVHEALAKSGLLWITSAAGSAPAWHVAVAGVAYTVSGPGEQGIPAHEGRVEIVTRSKETRARLATFEADADVVTPDDDDWGAATFALKAGRLNAPAHDVVARWQQECRITRYVPDTATVVMRGERLAPPAEQAADEQPPETQAAPSRSDASGTAPATSDAAPASKRSPSRPSARPAPASPSKPSTAPTADLGTTAPGEERPAAAAAEREHRTVERAEEAPGASAEPAADTAPAQRAPSEPDGSESAGKAQPGADKLTP